jgi:hypothetical protein
MSILFRGILAIKGKKDGAQYEILAIFNRCLPEEYKRGPGPS